MECYQRRRSETIEPVLCEGFEQLLKDEKWKKQLRLPSSSGSVLAQFGRFHRVETDAGARFRRSRTRALGFGYARVVLNNEPDLKDFITIRELVDYEPRRLESHPTMNRSLAHR